MILLQRASRFVYGSKSAPMTSRVLGSEISAFSRFSNWSNPPHSNKPNTSGTAYTLQSDMTTWQSSFPSTRRIRLVSDLHGSSGMDYQRTSTSVSKASESVSLEYEVTVISPSFLAFNLKKAPN